MLLTKKLSKVMKFLCVISLLTTISPGFAADDERLEEVSLNVSVRKNYTFGKDSFLKEELELIKDRQLNLWGVGLFSASDPVGMVIRTLTASNWSHCSLILIDEKDNTRYCFESTGAATQILNGVLPQVQISRWEDTVKNYGGSVSERQFVFQEKQPNSTAVVQYVMKYLGTSYQKDMSVLIDAIRSENTDKDTTLDGLFCSELAAHMLIQFDYLDGKVKVADNYLPRNFASTDILPWINGASLTKEEINKKKSLYCCTIL